MTEEERADLRLDIATRILAGDCSNPSPGARLPIAEIVALADALIRENAAYEAPPNGRTPDAPVSPAIKERVLDLGYELCKDRIDADHLQHIRKVYHSLANACGVTIADISSHSPF